VRHFDATFEVEMLVFPPTSMYHSIGEWVCYNFAAGSFLSKKLCSRLHSIEVHFYSKKRKSSLFAPPFRRLRGNVRTSSIDRWKALYDFIFLIIGLFFANSYCWDVTGGNLSTLAIFEGGWVTSIAHFRWKGTSPTNHFGWQKTRRIALSCGIKISPVGSSD